MGDYIINNEVEVKKKRYWLRGGVVGGITAILVYIIMLLRNTNVGGDIFGFLDPVLFFILLFFFEIPLPEYLNIIIFVLFLFIIGAIIGWIYRKIKNRGEQE